MSCKSEMPPGIIGKTFECETSFQSNVTLPANGNYVLYLKRTNSLYFKHESFGHKLVIRKKAMPKETRNIPLGTTLFFNFTE